MLQGLHGVGKNIIFDFFRDAVMGPRVAFKSSNPSKDIFGTHSVALRDRVFVNLDELSSEEIRPLMPRLKDLVTSSTVHVNPKNQPAYDVRNQANIFATSNQMNPIHVEPQERRIVVFACNGSKKGDTAYFGRLLAHLNGAKRDAVARAFYQYLRDNVEVAPFLPFQEHRPRTAAYVAMQERNIPLFYKFLSAAIRQAAECHTQRDTIKASTFHSQFHHWGRAGNYSTSTTTQSKFGGDLAALMLFLRVCACTRPTLRPVRVCCCLFRRCWMRVCVCVCVYSTKCVESAVGTGFCGAFLACLTAAGLPQASRRPAADV